MTTTAAKNKNEKLELIITKKLTKKKLKKKKS